MVLIIGDYTARVGDPERARHDSARADPRGDRGNAQTFQDQAFKVLDRERTEVRRNGEWLDMPAQELFPLLGEGRRSRGCWSGRTSRSG